MAHRLGSNRGAARVGYPDWKPPPGTTEMLAMKTVPLSVLAVAVGVGALVAAVTSSLLASSDEPTRVIESRVDGSSDSVTELVDQVKELQKQNRELLDRISALERRPVETARFGGKAPVTHEDLNAFAQELETKIADRPAPPEVLKTQVADTLQAIRKRENAVRASKKAEARRARLESNLGRMRKRLNLSTRQVNDLRDAFLAREERNRELERVWEEGRDPVVVGEMKRDNFQQHQAALERILTPQQLQMHTSARKDGRKD